MASAQGVVNTSCRAEIVSVFLAGMTLGIAAPMIGMVARTFLNKRRNSPQTAGATLFFIGSIINLLVLLCLSITQIALFYDDLLSRRCKVHKIASTVVDLKLCASQLSLQKTKISVVAQRKLQATQWPYEGFMSLMTDLVIICRARAIDSTPLWSSSLFSRVFSNGLFVLWVLCFACGLTTLIAAEIDLTTFTHSGRRLSVTLGAWIFAGLSVFINLLSTGLIMLRHWTHRHALHEGMLVHTRSLRVLSTLIESGFIYGIIQVLAYGLTLSPSPRISKINFPILTNVFFIVSGLYPALIYIITSNQGRQQQPVYSSSNDIPLTPISN